MNDYQGIARKFRPQTFDEVLGQEVIVTTLKNAIKHQRMAHAYLFCGSRGTGKTTLARIFAKALNCLAPLQSQEPCNQCSSCKGILSGSSLDVLEIDGASNRSIDDIRKINDNVGYATAGGKYKIYIIDEVHMLTKEAFNALLKTLEEPPPKVKFFFATTEPHKVLPTILSRCQRFNLKRISLDCIIAKLKLVAQTLERRISDQALRQIALKAEGGLRDAESILDQILAYHDGLIDEEVVTSALGIVPKDLFFTLDQEGKKGNLGIAFQLSYQIFSEGKDLPFFIEGLLEHFRTLSIIKLSGQKSTFLNLTPEEMTRYETSSSLYSKDQLLTILDVCLEAHQQIRHAPSMRIAVESLLLRIVRSHYKIPLEHIVERLAALEQQAQLLAEIPGSSQPPAIPPQKIASQEVFHTNPKPSTSLEAGTQSSERNVSIDPTPSFEDIKGMIKSKTIPTERTLPAHASTARPSLNKPQEKISKLQQAKYDTILQFASVELEGRIQKK
ncbi:MAG: DNA polymerase III subunit gamma/tau [Parachlamydiaceae bacterium]